MNIQIDLRKTMNEEDVKKLTDAFNKTVKTLTKDKK